MKKEILYIFLYCFIFLSSLVIKDNILNSNFIDMYPTWIASKLYLEDKKAEVYNNSAYGLGRSIDWINTESDIIKLGMSETNFVYLPTYLYPFVLLNLIIDYSTFKILFLFLNISIISYLIAIYFYKNKISFYLKYTILSILLISEPIRDILKLGQNIPLFALSLHFFYLNIIKNNIKSSVFYYILLLTFKPWGIVFGIYPFLLRKWKLLVSISSAMVIYLMYQYLFENTLFLGFLNLLIEHSKINLFTINNISLYNFLAKLLFIPSSENILLSWKPFEIKHGIIIKLFLLYTTCTFIYIAFSSKSKKISSLVTFALPLLLNNIFWNHYLIIYLKDFIRFPYLSRYLYYFLLFSLFSGKYSVIYYYNLVFQPISKINIINEIIITFPIIFLLIKYFKQGYYLIKINKEKNFRVLLAALGSIFLFLSLILIYSKIS